MGTKFSENAVKILSFFRWYPDLFLDLYKGSIKLMSDQRIMLRACARFRVVYGKFPRRWGKSLIETLSMVISCVLYPNMLVGYVAQTQETGAKVLKAKLTQIFTLFPGLKDEVLEQNNKLIQFSKVSCSIEFKNGSRLFSMSNSQSTKSTDANRGCVDEYALIDKKTYDDVLDPIWKTKRLLAIGASDYLEVAGKPCYFTTSGYKGSHDYLTDLGVQKAMREYRGEFAMSSDFRIPTAFGRGLLLSEIRNIFDNTSYFEFLRNYCGRYPGNTDNALVSIQSLIELRTLKNAEKRGASDGEYYIGVDVARAVSGDKYNAITVIAVIRVFRGDNGRVNKCSLVHLEELNGAEDFKEQALRVKKVRARFNGATIGVDNGGAYGVGLAERLNEESFCGATGECYAGCGVYNMPFQNNADDRCVYLFTPASENSPAIVNFMSRAADKTLELLEKKEYTNNIGDLPYILTDFLLDEIINLRLKQTSAGKYTVEQVNSKLHKDKYSALLIALWLAKLSDEAVTDGYNINDWTDLGSLW